MARIPLLANVSLPRYVCDPGEHAAHPGKPPTSQRPRLLSRVGFTGGCHRRPEISINMSTDWAQLSGAGGGGGGGRGRGGGGGGGGGGGDDTGAGLGSSMGSSAARCHVTRRGRSLARGARRAVAMETPLSSCVFNTLRYIQAKAGPFNNNSYTTNKNNNTNHVRLKVRFIHLFMLIYSQMLFVLYGFILVCIFYILIIYVLLVWFSFLNIFLHS